MHRFVLFCAHIACTALIVLLSLAFLQEHHAVGNGPCPCELSISTSCIGDSNGDGVVDVTDATYTLAFLFTGGPAPAANAQGSGNPASALTQDQVDLLQEVLPHLSIEQLPDGVGGTNRTVRFTGVNLQLVNGLGATNGEPLDPYSVDTAVTAVNGLGNLILGYEEASTAATPSARVGSHNLSVGVGNSYTAYGGLVCGWLNRSTGAYTSVVGGGGNTAGGLASVTVGGANNGSLGDRSVVCGGGQNSSLGDCSFVGGGDCNTTGWTGEHAAIIGGLENIVNGSHSLVAGGEDNWALARASSVHGGNANTADGVWATVSGGLSNLADELWATVNGGVANHANGFYSTISGGVQSDATGSYASVFGGFRNESTGFVSTVVGGRESEASGDHATATGFANHAAGESSNVSGGSSRTASGQFDWVAGALWQDQ
ncbi:MAG: hypothetical protein AAF581_01920 [Planctomycetota bacterium]